MRHRIALPMLLAGACVTTTASAGPDDVQARLESILAQPRYTFCHSGDYPMSRRDREMCSVAKGVATRCPAFRRACERLGALDESERPLEADDADVSASSTLVTVLLLTMLAAFAAVLVTAIIRNVRSGWDKAPEKEPKAPESPGPADRPARLVQTEKEALRLLARAKGAACEQRYGAAMTDLYHALLRHFEAEGMLHVDASKTNGDYARDLRVRPELAECFRRAARELERVDFGHEAPTQSRFLTVLANVEPILTRVLLAVILLGFAVTAQGCAPAERAPSSRGLYDDSASGLSVLRLLVEGEHATVERWTGSIEQFPGDEGEWSDTVIVHGDVNLTPEQWSVLLDWARDGGRLVIATDTLPQAGTIPGVVRTMWGDCNGLNSSRDAKVQVYGTRYWVKVQGPQWQTVVACGSHPAIAQAPLDDGSLVLIADSNFLRNASLAAGDNAYILLDLIPKPRLVRVIDSLSGKGTANPYKALWKSGLGAAFLQGLALMLVLYLCRGLPFGRLRDPVVNRRRAFAEHARALATIYQRAGASRLTLGMYAGWALERLHERVPPGSARTFNGLAHSIADCTGRSENAVLEVLAEAVDARDNAATQASTADDLRVMRTLGKILREMGGQR